MPSEILKIAVLPNWSFSIETSADGTTVIVDGFETAVLDMIMEGLQMQYRLLVSKENQWGVLTESGNWTGLIGMVQRREADIAVGGIFITESRMSVVDFSFPYTWYDITFATNKNAFMPKAVALFYPFSRTLWIYFIATFVIFILFLRIYPSNPNTLSQDIMDLIAILLRQPGHIKVTKLDTRLVFISWSLFSFFISYAYCSFLLSFLTIPTKESGIRSAEELSKGVSEGKYKCAIAKGSIIASSLMNSLREREKVIGRNILENDMFLDFRGPGVLKYMEDKTSVLLSSKEIFQLIFQDKFFISKDSFYSNPSAIAMKKKFPYKNRLNKILVAGNSAGIYKKCFDDYVFRKKLKNAKNYDAIEDKKYLSLNDLYGTFVILGIGNTLASLTCIGERLVFRLKQNNKHMYK